MMVEDVPKSVSTQSRDAMTIQTKIENFYEFMDREKENDRREKIKREKEKERELKKDQEEENIRREKYGKRDFEKELQQNYKSNKTSTINSEIGINMDGTSIGLGGGGGFDRKGLG